MIRNPNERQKELFINECNLMKRLKHDKIIKLYCISCKEDPMCMILEYMPNGSLKNYLKNNKTTLKFKPLIDIIIQISAGMKYLEEIQVIHRDLSARNVMVGKENLVKIGDFGLSQKLLDGVIDKRVDLPIKWMVFKFNYIFSIMIFLFHNCNQ
jgi:serine/threonine protein kinase